MALRAVLAHTVVVAAIDPRETMADTGTEAIETGIEGDTIEVADGVDTSEFLSLSIVLWTLFAHTLYL